MKGKQFVKKKNPNNIDTKTWFECRQHIQQQLENLITIRMKILYLRSQAITCTYTKGVSISLHLQI